MKALFFFFILSISIGNAQHVSIKRDSTLSTKDTVSLYIQNNMLSPLFFKSIPNDSTPKGIVYDKNMVVKPSEKRIHFMKIPRNILKSDSAKINLYAYFSFQSGYGDPNTVKHDDSYRYVLPYKKRRKLIQGNFGKFSHDHLASYYAFDFGTQIGDTLYAAREGKVVFMKEDSKKHGRTRKYISDGNFIIIQHTDGTTASYYHLDFMGVLVEIGDLVKRGQAIGISGMTGFTTIPHVHFVVHKATFENGNTSVPIIFEGYENKTFKKGKRYARKK